MSTPRTANRPHTSAALLAILPGPDRKRTASFYHYRLLYRSPEPQAPGCVLTWEVHGGRQSYQVTLERQDTGALRWHCTCADAVYRAENEGRYCKHLDGLLHLGRLLTDGIEAGAWSAPAKAPAPPAAVRAGPGSPAAAGGASRSARSGSGGRPPGRTPPG